MVSKVAIEPADRSGRAAIHSRTPTPALTGSMPLAFACCRASLRVTSRVIPQACVGPPTTSRSIPTGWASAEPTSITSTSSACARRPSPIASAICLVFPKMDSYTTRACMSSSLHSHTHESCQRVGTQTLAIQWHGRRRGRALSRTGALATHRADEGRPWGDRPRPLGAERGEGVAMIGVGVITHLLLAGALASSPTADGAEDAPVVIVVSGGISRGSYLAGQLYVFQEELRTAPEPPRLVLAGSSAGTVSAVVVALELHAHGMAPIAPERSALFRTWISLGLHSGPGSLDAYPTDKSESWLFNESG